MSIGRNDPCHCGSGKKYKKCCMASDQGQAATASRAPAPPTPDEQLQEAKTALARGDLGAARSHLAPLLKRKKVPAPVWALACGIELQARKFTQAREYIEKALQLSPENATYLYNHGTALSLAGKKEQAVKSFRRALAIKPDFYQASNNLANTLRDLGRPEEAVQSYLNVFEQNRHDVNTLNHVLVSLHQFSFTDGDKLFDLHCELGRRLAEQVPYNTPQRCLTDKTEGGKIRLGYLSPRFSREIVGYFFKPVFDHHDRSRFEIYLYSATEKTDDFTDHFKTGADKWTDITTLSDGQLCQVLVDDEIDILIDLAGHVPGNRIGALARKPVPIQISMLDYFDTTGVEAMDYYVTDHFSTPENGSQRFVEELIYIDQPRLVYEPPDFAPSVQLRPADTESLVFGSFNRLEKISQQVVVAWSTLLQEVAQSKLILKSAAFDHADVVENYTRMFTEQGVNKGQLEFRGKSPHVEMLSEYSDIDIALDTFPYNGGLTTLEALWMGTPVITLVGERIISRQSAGMLQALDLADFIARDTADIVSKARYWADHREALNELRKGLRERMAGSSLTDGKAFTRDLEQHLQSIWSSYQYE
jgi:predicted O-linked N-acetylglucosamine transferase (SPINDLY family)